MENKAENKIVVLEGFEQTLTKEMIWALLKKYGIKYITLNAKKLNAYLEFETEKQAKEAIDNFFGKPLLKKPVAMAFKSEKTTTTFVEFHLSGLDQSTVDLNGIYKLCSKFGKSCKFRFNLRTGGTKPSSGGYLSYSSITPAETENLKKELETVGIKTEPYNKEKTKKVSVKIDNFFEPFEVEKSILSEKISLAETKLKQALQELCQFNDKDDFKLSITARPNEKNLNQLFAYVIFEDQDKAIKFFEEIKKAKATYFTVNPQIVIRITEESESLANLFSIGLIKPADKTEEEFSADYLKTLQTEFDGILQVSIRPMKKKVPETAATAPVVETYLAFVTLDTEDHGRELLAGYNKDPKRKNLKRFYKGEPFFNIFISSNLKKELGKAKEGFKRMEKDIKSYGDNLKKEEIEWKTNAGGVRRAPFNYPVGNPLIGNPLVGNPMVGNPLAGNPLAGGFRPQMPIGMGGLPPMAPLGGGFPGAPINPLAGQVPILEKIDLLKSKDEYLTKDAQMVKRMLFHALKNDIQSIVGNSNQAIVLSNKILFESELKVLFNYLENKDELAKKVQSVTGAPTN